MIARHFNIAIFVPHLCIKNTFRLEHVTFRQNHIYLRIVFEIKTIKNIQRFIFANNGPTEFQLSVNKNREESFIHIDFSHFDDET